MRADRRLHLQAKRNTCAVAALRTVLDLQFGCKVQEAALELAGTAAETPIAKHGTGPGEMRRMLATASSAFNPGRPWRLRVCRNATVAYLITELAAGRKPIVSFRGPPGFWHAVVVLSIESRRVRVFDPAFECYPKGRFMRLRSFEREWARTGRRAEVIVGKEP